MTNCKFYFFKDDLHGKLFNWILFGKFGYELTITSRAESLIRKVFHHLKEVELKKEKVMYAASPVPDDNSSLVEKLLFVL